MREFLGEANWILVSVVCFGSFAIIVLLQSVGVLDEPTRVNLKIVEFNISSQFLGFVKDPLRKWRYQRDHKAWEAFDICDHSIGNNIIDIFMVNKSPYPVVGKAGFKFEFWGVPLGGKSHELIGTMKWMSPHDNIVYLPGVKFVAAGKIENYRLTAATVGLLIVGFNDEVSWQ